MLGQWNIWNSLLGCYPFQMQNISFRGEHIHFWWGYTPANQYNNIAMEQSTASRVSFPINFTFHQAAAREQMFAPNHLTLESNLNVSPFIPPRNGMEWSIAFSMVQLFAPTDTLPKLNKWFTSKMAWISKFENPVSNRHRLKGHFFRCSGREKTLRENLSKIFNIFPLVN